jgi:molybdopterin-guanine dinucleotide biosynthesis protein MobB
VTDFPRHPPAIAVSGPSGSGKTLLIEELVPRLMERGLRVAVVKHCSHRIDADHPGKDTDRMFRAGADVLAAGPTEAFARHHAPALPFARAISLLAPDAADLCLVEGYRGADLPRIVVAPKDPEGAAHEPLMGENEGGAHNRIMGATQADQPAAAENVLLTVTDSRAQAAAAEHAVLQVLETAGRNRPTYGVVLVGGRSSRMGQPKALLELDGATVLERVVSALAAHAERVLLAGDGPVPERLLDLPRLPDVPGLAGPLAGLLSAVRWAPGARWIVAACDLPLIEPAAVAWLLAQVRVGLDAVFPQSRDTESVEPLFSVYEPTARPFLERAADEGRAGPRGALAEARVLRPHVPEPLRRAWTNVNTPADWHAIQEHRT